MPANWTKGNPEREKAWNKAKAQFKKQTKKKEENWGDSEWAQVMSIAKKMLGEEQETDFESFVDTLLEEIDREAVKEAAMNAAEDIFDKVNKSKVNSIVKSAIKHEDAESTDDAIQIAINMLRSEE